MAQEDLNGLSDPLLDSKLDHAKKYVPDCPGCKTAYLRHKGAPAPYKLLTAIGFIILCNALPICVVYPFLYFMVRDFHIAKRQEDIGYYAGWIGSSFMLGRVATGVLWGFVADRYGRKPVMLIGIFSVLIFNTCFGVSTTLWTALLSRFLLGSFNGMLGTVKAYVSEVCTEENQALGVSVVGTTWGLGLIIGPALGGYLAQPALKYPRLFPIGSLFDRFPYLLQALCVSAFTLFGMCAYFTLPETLHRHPKSDLEHSTYIDSKGESILKEKSKSIYKNRSLMVSILVYCLWSLHDISYTETFSLWAESPKETGGLNLSTTDVGDILAISGFSMLIFQLTLYPLIAKFFGAIMVTRVSAALTIPLLVAYPFFYLLDGTSLWVVVNAASIAKNVLSAACMTGSFILINNSVAQNERGAANGLSLSIVSVFKAIGPVGGGSIFAWSQTRQHSSILPGDQLVFFALNVFAFLTAMTTFPCCLPSSTNHLPDNDDIEDKQ